MAGKQFPASMALTLENGFCTTPNLKLSSIYTSKEMSVLYGYSILGKWGEKVWTGYIWLRIGISERLL
jgi:hypothetical protein